MKCQDCEKTQNRLGEALQRIEDLESVVAFERKRANDAEESLRNVRAMLPNDPPRKFVTEVGGE